MAGLKEVKSLVGRCMELELEGRDILEGRANTQLASMYNGIGPESFPAWLRAVLDFLHPSLAPVAFIHDVEWSLSDGTEESFAASNRRFLANGCRVARALYPWWSPRRYAVMWHAWKFARCCQRFGWGAWTASVHAGRSGGAAVAVAAAALAALAGCASQEVVQREYYEPTVQTLQTRKDGMKIGALKSETTKRGSPDWSGNKSFSIFGIGN